MKSQKSRSHRKQESTEKMTLKITLGLKRKLSATRWFATGRPSGEVPFKNLKGNRKNMFLQTKSISADRGKACSEWFGKKQRLLLCVMKENPCEH